MDNIYGISYMINWKKLLIALSEFNKLTRYKISNTKLGASMNPLSRSYIQREHKYNNQKEFENKSIFTIVPQNKCQGGFILHHTKNFFRILFRHLLPQFPVYLSHMAPPPIPCWNSSTPPRSSLKISVPPKKKKILAHTAFT